MVVRLEPDPKVSFASYFVRAKNKTEAREFVGLHALAWCRLQHKRRAQGALIFDIDDTVLDGHERVAHGFPLMQTLFHEAGMLFPVYFVTARPDDQHANVMRMLKDRDFVVPPDRLYMLSKRAYDHGTAADIEEFKFRSYCEIAKRHGGVVARLGDKAWDCHHLNALHTYLAHVRDEDCHICRDPALKGTVSYKLPG